jgi:acyl-CoA synthetase (AMP-forming)/AMP-acid ligase II
VDYPDRPVLGLFTSGTTSGESRLVLYSKANIRASLAGIQKFFQIENVDSIFCYPQPFHTFGLLLGYVQSLELGVPLFTSEGRYTTAFHAERVTCAQQGLLTLGTPTHFLDLLSYMQAQQLPIAQSYSCIIGGASVSLDLWLKIQRELRILAPSVGYGASEASPGIAHLPAGQPPKENGEIGRLIEGLQVELHPGVGFEFSGPSVCLALIHAERIEFPRKIFISDEIEQRGEDGHFVFHGRSDFVLNRGGEKISLEAIESFLLQSLGLMGIAVAIPHPRLGQELGLWVTGTRSAEEVAQALSRQFGANFDARWIRVVDQLPLNASHKPDRHAILSAEMKLL